MLIRVCSLVLVGFFLLLSWGSLATSYVSHKLEGQSLFVKHDDGEFKVRALHDLAFEVTPINHPLVREDFPSFAIAPSLLSSASVPSVKIINSKTQLSFATSQLSVQINKADMVVSFIKNGQEIAKQEVGFFATHTSQGFRFKLQDQEVLMGTGERVLGMDRRGHRLPLYNRAHYGYETHSEQMNFSIPAVMSSNKYIILYDNPAKGWVDLGKTESDILQFEALGGRQAYVFIAGNDYPDLIHQYVKVTGKQPLPPRWAFGNHASRFGYRTQEEVINTIEQYRQLGIPVDSIILDLYWFGKDIQGHMGNLTWDKSAFPNPDEMIAGLNALDVKTTLITEPFILKDSKRWADALVNDVLAKNVTGQKVKTYDFYFGHTGLVDVFNTSAQDWFKDVYKDLHQQGITGVWGDLGEPEVHPSDMQHVLSDVGLLATSDEIHNAYGHQWASLVKETLAEVAPNQRPFILMRAGYAGSQRLGMLPWTGDVARSWNGLRPQPELTMQMGLLGMAYTHSDLGGFAGGETFDKEMYIRWLQYGVFQPIYRPHAQDNIAPEPVFHDAETVRIVRDFINLRYRLLPYNYSLAYQNSTTGLPLMRPMFFESETPEFMAMTQQFMWGDALLVKLVAEPDLESIDVVLPEGQWTDYWSDKVYQGGQTINYPLSLNTVPVLVKGGAIIPSVNNISSTNDYTTSALTLDIYFDAKKISKVVEMYEDDGQSADALEQGKFEKLIFNGAAHTVNDSQRYALNLSREVGAAGGYKGMPNQRELAITLHHWQLQPNELTFEQQPMAVFGNKKEFDLAKRGAFYIADKQQLLIKLGWKHVSNTTLNAPSKPALKSQTLTIR